MILKFVAHSRRVLTIARRYGWLPGARYTNLRDIRKCERVGFIDIDWTNYSFKRQLAAVQSTRPMLTVAMDVVKLGSLPQIIDQALELNLYCDSVIVVPKHPALKERPIVCHSQAVCTRVQCSHEVWRNYDCSKILSTASASTGWETAWK